MLNRKKTIPFFDILCVSCCCLEVEPILRCALTLSTGVACERTAKFHYVSESYISCSRSVCDLTTQIVMCSSRLRTWYYVPGLRLVSKWCDFATLIWHLSYLQYMPNVWEHLQPVRLIWYMYLRHAGPFFLAYQKKNPKNTYFKGI